MNHLLQFTTGLLQWIVKCLVAEAVVEEVSEAGVDVVSVAEEVVVDLTLVDLDLAPLMTLVELRRLSGRVPNEVALLILKKRLEVVPGVVVTMIRRSGQSLRQPARRELADMQALPTSVRRSPAWLHLVDLVKV